MISDVNKERELLNEEGRWRLKPLLTLPTGIYDLVRGEVPDRLLEQETGFVQLVGLQTQCVFMNQVADEHRKWRSPAARHAPDQLEVIANFHPVIGETLQNVIRRCDEFMPTLEAAAQGVGGLKLKPVHPDSASPAVASRTIEFGPPLSFHSVPERDHDEREKDGTNDGQCHIDCLPLTRSLRLYRHTRHTDPDRRQYFHHRRLPRAVSK
jgi:hypothetical protein